MRVTELVLQLQGVVVENNNQYICHVTVLEVVMLCFTLFHNTPHVHSDRSKLGSFVACFPMNAQEISPRHFFDVDLCQPQIPTSHWQAERTLGKSF